MANSEEPIRRLRILIVDDHPSICEIIGAYLATDAHDLPAIVTACVVPAQRPAQPVVHTDVKVEHAPVAASTIL